MGGFAPAWFDLGCYEKTRKYKRREWAADFQIRRETESLKAALLAYDVISSGQIPPDDEIKAVREQLARGRILPVWLEGLPFAAAYQAIAPYTNPPPMVEQAERAALRGKNALRGNPPPLLVISHIGGQK
ncbi:hypothetical protein [Eikenella corrodens]|uniref:hypothetical protein n=1 Tax=Eikenella corrodens TaxID=539 RepID=UPI000428AF1A|nr:hypothetical protein [Eikenella corrodens]